MTPVITLMTAVVATAVVALRGPPPPLCSTRSGQRTRMMAVGDPWIADGVDRRRSSQPRKAKRENQANGPISFMLGLPLGGTTAARGRRHVR